jgi:uncharacterized protein YlxW (UPF0749 family)
MRAEEVAMAIQEELKAQPPPADGDELYEEEPRRRPWAAIGNVVLALAVIFVGYQWNQAASREQALASQAQALRAEAESLRLRTEDGQRQVAELQKRMAAVAAEKSALTERVAALEKTAQERASAAARDTTRPGVTPVAGKKKSR